MTSSKQVELSDEFVQKLFNNPLFSVTVNREARIGTDAQLRVYKNKIYTENLTAVQDEKYSYTIQVPPSNSEAIQYIKALLAQNGGIKDFNYISGDILEVILEPTQLAILDSDIILQGRSRTKADGIISMKNEETKVLMEKFIHSLKQDEELTDPE